MGSNDSLQDVGFILLSSTGLLQEDELENSGLFMPQIPLFPNNILGIAFVLSSTLISQHGLLGVQQTPKDGVTPGSEGVAEGGGSAKPGD